MSLTSGLSAWDGTRHFVCNRNAATRQAEHQKRRSEMARRERIVYAFDITGPPLGLIENTLAPPRWITFEARVNF